MSDIPEYYILKKPVKATLVATEEDPKGFQNVYTCGICGKDVLPSSGGYFHV